jgi:glucoamylase
MGWGQGRAWPLLGGERAHYELAAGHDVKPLIKAYEQFSSVGGMLPEQVWDFHDIPSEGMYEGRSAGSAQPLVWAHAEYVKLLRSVVDGKIFDTISVVAERYAVPPGTRTFVSNLEVFQVARPVTRIPAGDTLRIVDDSRFKAVYTMDNWQTTQEVTSRVIGFPGSFADIAIDTSATGKLIFTLQWFEGPDQPEHWLGRNVEVEIVPQEKTR